MPTFTVKLRISGLKCMSEGGLAGFRKGHDLNAKNYKHTAAPLSKENVHCLPVCKLFFL